MHRLALSFTREASQISLFKDFYLMLLQIMISSGVIASLLIGSIIISRNFLSFEKDRAWQKFKVTD